MTRDELEVYMEDIRRGRRTRLPSVAERLAEAAPSPVLSAPTTTESD